MKGKTMSRKFFGPRTLIARVIARSARAEVDRALNEFKLDLRYQEVSEDMRSRGWNWNGPLSAAPRVRHVDAHGVIIGSGVAESHKEAVIAAYENALENIKSSGKLAELRLLEKAS